ncbi:hypothetical protein EFN35_00775 [Pediococcus parvulus]|nr:hypothetical protein [Pediococcus parvulus]
MKRNSSIELARILSIAFILLSHFSLWSNWDSSLQDFFNYSLTMIYQPLGKFGVYIFVLITSYFSLGNCKNKLATPQAKLRGKSEYLLKVKIIATHYMIYEYVLLQFEKLLLGFDTSRYVAVIG